MSAVTIEFTLPELTEAINNLARAQTAATEALNRFMSLYYSNAGFTGYDPAYPAQHSQMAPVLTNIPEPAVPLIETSKLFTGHETKAEQKQGAGYSVLQKPAASSTPPAPVNPAQPGMNPSYTQAAAPVSAERSYSLEELARAVASLMGAGKYLLVVELLAKFGVQALFQLPKEYFGAFAAALRQLGAQI